MSIYTSKKVLPYVYMGIHRETGQFYIGSRTNKRMKLPPEQDLVKYRTSSKIVKPIFDQFDWTIVAMFFDPLECYNFEQELIYQYWNNPLKLNQCCTTNGVKFTNVGISFTAQHKERLRIANIKRNYFPSINTRAKYSDDHSLIYIIIDQHGSMHLIKNLKAYCENNGLSYTSMLLISQGKVKQHNRIRCVALDSDMHIRHLERISPIIESGQYKWVLMDINGQIFETFNLINFAKQFGLDSSALYRYAHGLRPSKPKGWHVEKVVYLEPIKITTIQEFIIQNTYTMIYKNSIQ